MCIAFVLMGFLAIEIYIIDYADFNIKKKKKKWIFAERSALLTIYNELRRRREVPCLREDCVLR